MPADQQHYQHLVHRFILSDNGSPHLLQDCFAVVPEFGYMFGDIAFMNLRDGCKRHADDSFIGFIFRTTPEAAFAPGDNPARFPAPPAPRCALCEYRPEHCTRLPVDNAPRPDRPARAPGPPGIPGPLTLDSIPPDTTGRAGHERLRQTERHTLPLPVLL